jgi:hypothetical protein
LDTRPELPDKLAGFADNLAFDRRPPRREDGAQERVASFFDRGAIAGLRGFGAAFRSRRSRPLAPLTSSPAFRA